MPFNILIFPTRREINLICQLSQVTISYDFDLNRAHPPPIYTDDS